MIYSEKADNPSNSGASDMCYGEPRRQDEFERELLPEIANLRNYALSLTQDPSDASDLVQDTVLKALENRRQFRRGTYMRRWLFTILRNRFLDGWRQKSTRGAHIPIEDCNPSRLSRPGSQEDLIELRECERKLGRVPRLGRMILLLSVFTKLSHKEAADRLGIAEGTVRSRLSRTRAELRARTGRVG